MEEVTWKPEAPDEDGKRQMVLAGMDPGDDHQSKRVRLTADGGDAGNAGLEIQHLKMLVLEKETGNVIGRGGELLRQIRSESGARVHISAMDEVLPVTRERIITISGALPSLLCAQHLISETLQNARLERAQKIAASSGEAAPVSDGTRTLKLLFPHVSCGVIMGRGGSFIKELMGATGAVIKVSQPAEMIQATQERVITISGPVSAVDSAQDAITRRMAQAPPQQQIRETDYSVLKFAAQGPPPPRMAPPPQAWGYPGLAPAVDGPMGGLGSVVLPYKTFISTLPDSVSPDEASRLYADHCRTAGAAAAGAAAVGGMGGMGGGGGGPPVAKGGGEVVTDRMAFSDRIISGIIGRGGANIRDVIARSGARVNVSQKDAPDRVPGERTVTIVGSADQVATAKDILAGRVREIEAEGAARQVGGAGGGPPAFGGAAAAAGYGGGGGSRYVPGAPPLGYAPQGQQYTPQPFSPPQPSQYAPPPAPAYPQYPLGYATSPTPPGYAFGASNPWGGSSGYSW